MNQNEKGFTFIEICISLHILGLIAFFIIPIFMELRAYEQQHVIRLEAMLKGQEKIEQLRFTLHHHGQEKVRSNVVPYVMYSLIWKCHLKERYLYQIEVEIRWNKGKEKKKIMLSTFQYLPY